MFEEVVSELGIPLWILVIVLVWSLTWKGLALWKSARLNQPVWFIIILFINTLGLIEILYIFLFSKIDFNNLQNSNQTERKTTKIDSKRSSAKRRKR